MSSSERVDMPFLDPFVLCRPLVMPSALNKEVIILADDCNASLKSTVFPMSYVCHACALRGDFTVSSIC